MEELFWMEEIGICGMDTRAGLSFSEELDNLFYLITHHIICVLLYES